MTTDDFSAAYARIQSVTNTRTQTELADILGIRQSSISDAKKRGEIPAGWLITVLKAYCVNPEWIVSGEGAQYLTGESGQTMDVVRINWYALGSEIESIQKRACSEIMAIVQKATRTETQA